MTSDVDMIDIKARSSEGRGLSIHSGDRWIDIQKNTFLNWVNLQLHSSGLIVSDFETDFDDGVRLCALVENLQHKKIGRVVKKPINQHQRLENVSLALRAIAEDNVRLVNIGSEDIVNGSLKLILGLIWHLILRYQIGKTKVPPKKLMLAWLQAVVPECNIKNFTSDWNDGVALHALIDYCQPGLYPNWRQLSRHDRLENCQNAMTMAKEKLNIPIVVRPEDFSSPHLDELSGMTYLSYYMMVDSPGYFATRREIRALLQQGTVDNFTTDWNDGRLLCSLVKSVGGDVPGWPTLTKDHEQNLQNGINGAKKLGIEPIFTAKEMADPEVEHLGIMAYAAYFRNFKPVKISQNKASLDGHFTDVRIKQEKHFVVHAEDGTPHNSIHAEVVGPDSIVPVRTNWSGNRADCYFTPTECGQHKLNVLCDGKNIPGCPVPFKVHSDKSKIKFDHLDTAVVGVTRELKVDTSSAGHADIKIEAVSPSGRVMDMPVVFKEGILKANFTPTEVGNWQISTFCDGEHLNGSPYTVKVFDPSLVRITDLHEGKVGQELSFQADASAAGEGEVTCQVFHGNSKVQSYLTKKEHGKYKVDFTPNGPGTYTVHAYLNKMEVKGSPYTVDIVDYSRVTVSGDGLSLVPVNTPAVFNIHTQGTGVGKVDVSVVAPSGKHITCEVTKVADDKLRVDYVPKEAGIHTIEVKVAEQKVSGSPFLTNAYDIRKLVISKMPSTAMRDQQISFNIDASQAGSGNVEICVNKGRVPCTVQNKGNHCFTGSFVPENTQPHLVEMSFNGTPVVGSPWTITIIDPKSVYLKGKERIPCNQKATIQVHSNNKTLVDDLVVSVTGPNGESVPHKMSDSNGDKVVKFTPTQAGDYSTHVKYGPHEVYGSPFVTKAFNIGAITVSPLHDGFVNQPMYFTIDVGEAGEGQLQIMVNNGNTSNDFKEDKPGHYKIKFIPAVPGRQQVDILFNDIALPCSPLICHAKDLSANVVGLNHLIPVQSASSFRVQSQSNMDNMTVPTEVIITAPNGENIPARLVQQPDGDYKVEWTPHKPGRHSVDVLFGGQQIQGSPFYIDVFDIHKIRVNKFYQGSVNEKAGFELDCTQVGSGTQEIRIQSPSGHTLPFRVKEGPNLIYNVNYTPMEAGLHTINVSYSGMELNGSPFHQNIGEGALPTAHGEGLHKGEEDKPAHFTIDARNMKGTPSVQVDGPNAIAKCSIDPLPDGQYTVTYIPVEVGLFDVYVRWNDREIPGSPFHPKVVDSRKVKVVGGWQHYMDGQERVHLVVGEEKKIPFDTSEAGPGQLRAEVKSPSSLIPVDVDDVHKGKSVVRFTPREEGNHYIYLHWSDHPLVNSPYLGYATGGAADPSRVWLSGRGLKEAVVKEEAEFTIDASQAGPGEPDVQLTGVRVEVPVITSPLGGGKFRCTYIPVVPGAYLLNISWNGRQLRGAPYKVNVIGASFPDRVVVNGEGLNGGLLGQSLNFRIDTRKAGPGELTAYCTGPNKVASCELKDHHDGTYSLLIRPQETGRHTLQVKYSGEHVQGSPYTFRVSAQPDASKVRVSGPGVEHGILANFQSQFIVETRGAGAGQLSVKIRGPKGAFQVEMYRESQKDRTILCRYYPAATGLYIISVRWSEVDVPGSPFHVQILDTHQELEQVLRESSFSGSGHQHQLAHPSSSFHNSSVSSANHVRYYAHQNGHHHNVSRNSSYYQWN